MRFSARSFFHWGKTFIFLLLLSFFITPLAHAQTATQAANTNPSAPYYIPNTSADVPANQHTLIQSTLIEMMSSGICLLSNIDIENPSKGCLGVDPQTHKIGYTPTNTQIGGAIGDMSGMITTLYTPPASLGEYTHYLSSRFGVTNKAYAANNGSGYEGLRPLLGMWSASRNLAYMLFILAFVIIGFSIMLRVKIDPRTVMTIQNQIPKIIVAIVMITFSYAIVGALIDFMWVTTYAVINLITSPAVGNIDSRVPTIDILNNPFTYFQHTNSPNGYSGQNSADNGAILGMSKNAAGEVGTIIRDTVGGLLGISSVQCDLPGALKSTIGIHASGATVLGGVLGTVLLPIPIVGTVIGAKIGSSIDGGTHVASLGDCVGALVDWTVYHVSGFIFFLIILIAILIALFRIWFILIKAYAFILFDTIVAPLWITVGIFPNSSLNFQSWIRHIIAHLALFPTVTAMFLLVNVLTTTYSNAGQTLFIPPLIGNGNVGSNIAAVLGLGMLFLIPEMLNILRDALKSPASKHAGGLGKSIGFGAAPLGMVGGSVGARLWRKDAAGNPIGTIPDMIGTFSEGKNEGVKKVLRLFAGKEKVAPPPKKPRNQP